MLANRSSSLNHGGAPAAVAESVPSTENIWERRDITFEQYMDRTAPCYVGGCAMPPTPVPYMFCTDDREGWWVECQAYDHGATLRDVNIDRMERYDKYYVLNNFKRDRFGFGSSVGLNRYISRLLSRYLLPHMTFASDR